MDDLVSSYGFHFINVEEMVFNELPKKLERIVRIEDMQDVRHILEVRILLCSRTNYVSLLFDRLLLCLNNSKVHIS